MRIYDAQMANMYIHPEGDFKKDWHVFENDICIDENVIIQPNKMFSLKYLPVGKIRILLVNENVERRY